MRLKIGLSQNDIAYVLGVNPAEVCKMEARHRLPSVAQIIALEMVYGASAQYLLSELQHIVRQKTLRRAHERMAGLKGQKSPRGAARNQALQQVIERLHH